MSAIQFSRGSTLVPTRLALAALLAVLVLLPPEARGESMAGAAVLVVLLSLTATPRDGRIVRWLLVAGVAGGIALARAGLAPLAAVEPLAVLALAAAAGLAASSHAERDAGLLRIALLTLACLGALVALYALYQRLWGLERLHDVVLADPAFPDRDAVLTRLGRGRAFGWFSTPAALGGFLALTIPVTAGSALSAVRRPGRFALLVAVTAQAAGLIATASATAVSALLGAVAIAALLDRRAGRRWLAAVIVLAAALAVVVGVRGDRLLDADDPEGPLRLRAGNFRAAATMIGDHPWTGVGPGAFADAYPTYRRPGENETRHAHDLPLELAAEWGVPAGVLLTALFFGVFLSPVLATRRSRRPVPVGPAIGLAAFALQNLADFTAFMPSLLWTSAILAGLIRSRTGQASPVERSAGERVIAGWSLAAVVVAAAALASGGIADNARIFARSAAFDGERELARSLAERASRLAPWDRDAVLLHARITLDDWLAEPSNTTRRNAARESADRAVRVSPVSAAARAHRARYRLAAGDASGAFADFGEAARLHPAEATYATSRDQLRTQLAPGSEAP